MAARCFPDTQILLAGPPEVIDAQLEKLAPCPANIAIVPASERIGMDESPVQALREKRDSSIAVGMTKVVEAEADAFVSAGNTGAVVAASSLGLGLIAGVQRPGIVVPMRLIDRPLIVIDVGANIHCKSMHLLQYGIMATVFAREIFQLANPRVGLLNVGEEAGKGTELVKKAFRLLSAAELNFVGNVEAKDALSGACDILVCDGFAGNVLLKTCEALVTGLMSYLDAGIRRNWRRKLGWFMCRDVFEAVRQSGDYTEYGGAPLLGVDGVTIISHGRSDAKAIASAVREARSFLELKVNETVGAAIRAALPLGATQAPNPCVAPRYPTPDPGEEARE